MGEPQTELIRPKCAVCAGDGVSRNATHVGAQSVDSGKTVTWQLVCAPHVDGWNDQGDWMAPCYLIGGVGGVPYTCTHVPDRLSARQADGASGIVDVQCSKCGTWGSATWEPEDVQWDDD